jgi:hypothetical protein
MRSYALSIVIVLAAGCGPTVAELRSDGACQTWVEGVAQNWVARVDGNQAVLRAALGERPGAFFVHATEIYVPSAFGPQRMGSYQNGALMLHTALGDDGPYSMLGERASIARSAFGELVVDHNEHCRPPQIALGSVTLFLAYAASQSSVHH